MKKTEESAFVNPRNYSCRVCENKWIDEQRVEPYYCPRCGSSKIAFKYYSHAGNF